MARLSTPPMLCFCPIAQRADRKARRLCCSRKSTTESIARDAKGCFTMVWSLGDPKLSCRCLAREGLLRVNAARFATKSGLWCSSGSVRLNPICAFNSSLAWLLWQRFLWRSPAQRRRETQTQMARHSGLGSHDRRYGHSHRSVYHL